MSKKKGSNNDGTTTIRVSPEFSAWLASIKIHKNQSKMELCDTIMELCKQKGVLEGSN